MRVLEYERYVEAREESVESVRNGDICGGGLRMVLFLFFFKKYKYRIIWFF